MAKLEEYKTATSTKILLLGEPGAGKTGSLASLASAGYNLRIIDLERGLDILVNLLRDWEKNGYTKDAISRVDFLSLADKRSKDGKYLPTEANTWQRVKDAYYGWGDYGPVSSWGPQDVFVIDSLTELSQAALNFHMYINAQIGREPTGKDIGAAQGLVLNFLRQLWDTEISCNIIILAHINYQDDDLGIMRGFPTTVGKALNPHVGKHFTSIIQAKIKREGTKDVRVISTIPTTQILLRTTAPNRTKDEYPIKTALADYFRDVRGS